MEGGESNPSRSYECIPGRNFTTICEVSAMVQVVGKEGAGGGRGGNK